jgi:protein gp37
MGKTTGIDWTDRTWNPWQGCHPIATGCAHCYMHREKRRYGQDPGTVVRSKPPTFNQPVSKKWAEPAKVFVCSWSDFFIEEADLWRDEAWDIMRRASHLTYQIPTKRPGRIAQCLPDDWGDGWPNVWIGASASTQADLEGIVPYMDVVRWLSLEPLVGPIHFRLQALRAEWVVVGAESGPSRRRCDDKWVRDIVGQCGAAGIPCFVKQIHDCGRLVKMPQNYPQEMPNGQES